MPSRQVAAKLWASEAPWGRPLGSVSSACPGVFQRTGQGIVGFVPHLPCHRSRDRLLDASAQCVNQMQQVPCSAPHDIVPVVFLSHRRTWRACMCAEASLLPSVHADVVSAGVRSVGSGICFVGDVGGAAAQAVCAQQVTAPLRALRHRPETPPRWCRRRCVARPCALCGLAARRTRTAGRRSRPPPRRALGRVRSSFIARSGCRTDDVPAPPSPDADPLTLGCGPPPDFGPRQVGRRCDAQPRNRDRAILCWQVWSRASCGSQCCWRVEASEILFVISSPARAGWRSVVGRSGRRPD